MLQNVFSDSGKELLALGNPSVMTNLRPGLAQHVFGVPGGVSSPVEMAIGLMHVSVLWRVLGKVLLGCGGCPSHAQQGRHHRLVAGVGDGKGHCSSTVCTLEPLGSEIVTHDSRSHNYVAGEDFQFRQAM